MIVGSGEPATASKRMGGMDDTREPPMITTFGDLLRRCRVNAGLTQEELAEQAHLSARAVSDLERGIKRAPRRDTVAQLVEALRLSPRDRVALRSAARPLGAAGARQGRVRTTAGAPTAPFVGRVPELALIGRHLAGDEEPLLLLAGEPGIGKTRLLQATASLAESRGSRVLEGGCARWGDQGPFQPLLTAVQRHLGGLTRPRLRTELRGCAWLTRLMPELSSMGIEPLPSWSLSAGQEYRLMVEALIRFLHFMGDAGDAGTVLLLDDLQWAGADALGLIAAVVRATPHPTVPGAVPLRVIGAYRNTDLQPGDTLPTVIADLAHMGLAAERQLGPLSDQEAVRLLEGLLDNQPRKDLRRRVLQQSGGVPFFLVSWARMLRDDTQTNEEDIVGDSIDSVPWTVTQGIRRRVVALPDDAVDVITVASVAGRQTSRALLAMIVDWPERRLVTALEATCRARLLEEWGSHEYRFPHDVIREVVEAALSTARRTSIHQHIAQSLARLPGERRVEEIAYHYARTELHAEAATWLELAGDRAVAAFANLAALEHYGSARDRTTGGIDCSRLDEKLGDVRVLLGEYEQAQKDFAQARENEIFAARRADLRRKEGVTWDKRGEFSQALAAFTAAADEGTETQVLPALILAQVELSRGEVQLRQGYIDAALAATERALTLLGTASWSAAVDAASVRAAIQAGELAFVRNDFVGAYEYHQRSLALAERIGDQAGIAESLSDLGYEAGRQGDHTQAQNYLRRALQVFERIGDQEGIAACLLRQGGTAEHLGALTEAASCYGRSLTIQQRIGDQWGAANSWTSRGRVALLLGELSEAQACHTHALALFERLGDDAFIAAAWNGIGAAACERGDFAGAVRCCGRARRLALQAEEPELAAVAALGLARAYLRAQPPRVSRLHAALALASRSREVAVASEAARQVVWALLVEAEAYVALGTPKSALTIAEEALRLAESGHWTREAALARRLLGQSLLAHGDRAGAEVEMRRALAQLTEIGVTLEAARTCMALAALPDPVNDLLISTEQFALVEQARQIFIACEAAWDQDQANRIHQQLAAQIDGGRP
jgi:tetratricopeptide (TPR) repeat protein/transcriptional regulator with XRE-family HTH domain